MREFEYTFDKGLVRGLRTHHKNPRNSQALVECMNVRCTPSGLEAFPRFFNVLGALDTGAGYVDDDYVSPDYVEFTE